MGLTMNMIRSVNKAVKDFAEKHHMEWCRVDESSCTFLLKNNEDPVHQVLIRRVGEYLIVETCLTYPIKPTLKNLRWMNRLNANLGNIRLVIDDYLKFTEIVKLGELDLSSNEEVEGLFLGGTFWMMFHGEAIGNFLLGKLTEEESFDAIVGKKV